MEGTMDSEGPSSSDIVWPKKKEEANFELAQRDMKKLIAFFKLLDEWQRARAAIEDEADLTRC